MNRDRMLHRLRGCYVTVPTQFRDADLELSLPAIRRHVEFLLAGGIREGTGILLAGGAAADNHWPQFGIHLWQLVEERKYEDAQWEMVRVLQPYMQLWAEMEQFTSGDGYLDNLCMELVDPFTNSAIAPIPPARSDGHRLGPN